MRHQLAIVTLVSNNSEGASDAGLLLFTIRGAGESAVGPKRRLLRELNARQKGPGRTTRMLVDGIVQSATISGTVLDIGSGVGALTFTLCRAWCLKCRRGRCISFIRQCGARRSLPARACQRSSVCPCRFRCGGLSRFPSASIVTLNVLHLVCCSPSCIELLEAAVEHTERCLALSCCLEGCG